MRWKRLKITDRVIHAPIVYMKLSYSPVYNHLKEKKSLFKKFSQKYKDEHRYFKHWQNPVTIYGSDGTW